MSLAVTFPLRVFIIEYTDSITFCLDDLLS
jgi:hypothetical protein